jgi:ATP-binding cassette subfamily B multidrug efflux pump
VGTNLGGSYMMRSIINNFIWSGCTDFAGLAQAVLVLVVVYVAGCAAAYGQSAVMVRLAQRGVNRLRKDLFDKLQALPLSYFDQHPHGELMSRFTNDADNVQMALEQSVVSLCSSVLMFAGLVSMMLFINWKLFLVTALLLAVTIVLFKTLGGRSRKFYRAQQSALGNMNGEIQEIIEGLKVVKAFTHEEQAKADFRALNTAYRDAAQKANFYSIMIMPVSGNLMNISYALTAAFGGLLSVLQGFDLGGLVVYLNYSKQVGQPLNQISQQMTTLLSALAGAERIFDVMDTQPEVDQGQVTLVEALPDVLMVGTPVCDANTDMLKALLPFHGVKEELGARVVRTEPDGVVLHLCDGSEQKLEADTIAVAVGYRSENRLFQELQGLDAQLFQIGDANKVANIHYAIWDAYEVARGI